MTVDQFLEAAHNLSISEIYRKYLRKASVQQMEYRYVNTSIKFTYKCSLLKRTERTHCGTEIDLL